MEFFSGTCSTEEVDFMSHLFGTKLPNASTSQASSALWPHHSLSVSNKTNANMPVFTQENTCTDGSNAIFPTSSGESYLSLSSENGISVTPFIPAAEYNSLSWKYSCNEADEDHTSWKKPKFSKTQKLVSKVNTAGVDHDVAKLNTSGRKRACNGSAIDSQSVYAKKRRERINERLRILQNLVPNGTKVDISTMLEEAVEYVKFLQLQIKLLSSDDLWMYAPIAYNGLDLGLDVKLPSTR